MMEFRYVYFLIVLLCRRLILIISVLFHSSAKFRSEVVSIQCMPGIAPGQARMHQVQNYISHFICAAGESSAEM